MKVLVIDDSNMVLALVKQILTAEAGYEVFTAGNGKVAMDMLVGGTCVDIILLDWNMPVMDGPSFLEANLKDRFTSAPIMMLTTENKPQYISKALQLGACEYIMKPFTEDILISKIQMVMDQAS